MSLCFCILLVLLRTMKCVYVCNDNICNISPIINEDIYICGSNVDICTLQCNYQKCKTYEFTFYSIAKNTIIQCGGDGTCEGKTINIGSVIPTQYGILSNDIILNMVLINCNDIKSCAKSNININGNFVDNISINGKGVESLKDSIITCTDNIRGKCVVSCMKDNSCINTEFDCTDVNQCICNGITCPIIDPITIGAPITTVKECVSKDVCRFEPNGDMTVVCTNAVDTCIIDCTINPQQCKDIGNGLKVYSAAKNTIIQCSIEDGCNGATFNIGIPNANDIPNGYDISQFSGVIDTVTFNCFEKASCKEATININAFITSTVIIDAFGIDSFQKSEITVNIDDSQIIQLNCGNNENYKSCEFSKYNCVNGNCYCSGNSCCIDNERWGYCQNIIINEELILNTPTNAPTIKPSNNNGNYCNNNECIITPNNDDTNVYICSNEYDICEVTCAGTNCNNIEIYSGSKNTYIECIYCVDISVNIGATNKLPNGYDASQFISTKDSIYIDCYNCTNMDININSDFSINSSINIDTNNINALYNSNIDCKLSNNNQCNINCINNNYCNSINILCSDGLYTCKSMINCNGNDCNSISYTDTSINLNIKSNNIDTMTLLIVIGMSILYGCLCLIYFCFRDYTNKYNKLNNNPRYSTQNNIPSSNLNNNPYHTFEVESAVNDS